MKITKSQLRQIIKEEVQKLQEETEWEVQTYYAGTSTPAEPIVVTAITKKEAHKKAEEEIQGTDKRKGQIASSTNITDTSVDHT